MDSNQKASGDGLVGNQKEAALRTLVQRTGYQLKQVRPERELWIPEQNSISSGWSLLFSLSGERSAALRWTSTWLGWTSTWKGQWDICGETTQRSVWGWTCSSVWEGETQRIMLTYKKIVASTSDWLVQPKPIKALILDIKIILLLQFLLPVVGSPAFFRPLSSSAVGLMLFCQILSGSEDSIVMSPP